MLFKVERDNGAGKNTVILSLTIDHVDISIPQSNLYNLFDFNIIVHYASFASESSYQLCCLPRIINTQISTYIWLGVQELKLKQAIESFVSRKDIPLSPGMHGKSIIFAVLPLLFDLLGSKPLTYVS